MEGNASQHFRLRSGSSSRAPKPRSLPQKDPKRRIPLTARKPAYCRLPPPAPPAATESAARSAEILRLHQPVNQPNKRAFFMEGEDIHVVREGDVVKSRYKIVRIGVNSVVVEDMQFKSQQTLPLEEQPT